MRGHIWQWDGWCSLKIPNEWNVDEEDGVITLARADGVGALQVSFARRRKRKLATSADAIEMATSFAKSRGWNEFELGVRIIGNSPGAQFEYRETTTEEDTYWCIWSVTEKHRAALITYVCAMGEKETERDARDHIVGSFRWL